jgi:hypothetical protein
MWVWDYLAPLTAIFVAVLGIVPAVAAFHGAKRWAWVVGIIAGLAINVLASIFSVRSAHVAQEESSGGDNFLTIIAVIPDPKDTKAHFPLFIINDHPLPVFDVNLQIVNVELVNTNLRNLIQGHGSIDDMIHIMTPEPIKVGTVPRLNSLTTPIDNIALPVGTYQIGIQTRRALFTERLTLRVENGEVRESWYITKYGSSVKLAGSE